MSFRTYTWDVNLFETDTKGRLLGVDVSINWPSKRNWQTQVLDSWKATRLDILRQNSVKNWVSSGCTARRLALCQSWYEATRYRYTVTGWDRKHGPAATVSVWQHEHWSGRPVPRIRYHVAGTQVSQPTNKQTSTPWLERCWITPSQKRYRVIHLQAVMLQNDIYGDRIYTVWYTDRNNTEWYKDWQKRYCMAHTLTQAMLHGTLTEAILY